MKRLAAVLLLACVFAGPASAGRFDDCFQYVYYGDPGGTGVPLCRIGYATVHDGTRKVPVWVAERLTKEHVSVELARSNDFRADSSLPAGARAELEDYRGSGYDRGHMAPAADFRWSAQAMSESFLLSNMAPQVGPGMNRGVWADLEGQVRDWVRSRGELYVFTGPVYLPSVPPKSIGVDGVAVPDEFYKVVFDPIALDAVSFVMPNRTLDQRDLSKYVVSIDEVEAKTGLDFLNAIRDDVEALIEVETSPPWR